MQMIKDGSIFFKRKVKNGVLTYMTPIIDASRQKPNDLQIWIFTSQGINILTEKSLRQKSLSHHIKGYHTSNFL